MRARVKSDTGTRVISIEVTDGPDLDVTERWQSKTRTARVEWVQIELFNGETKRVTVSGHLINKDGTVGQLTGRRSWGTDKYGGLINNAPDFVRQIWEEAPSGATEWTWGAEA